MIRLVFVSTLAYNYFFPGKVKQAGGHTRIYNLSKAFATRSKYKVYCITGDFGQEPEIEKDGVTLIKTPVDNPFAFLTVWSVIKSIKPDILVDFCASPRLFLYYMMQKVMGLKYVFLTCCDNDVNGDYRKTENYLFYLMYVTGLKKADRIVAQVPFHQEVLSRQYHLEAELILSPYLEIKKNKPGVKDSILWVGRAAYYKRPEVFVKLARQFPNQQFIMICNTSAYDNGFMSAVKQGQNLPENLEFHEYVPYPEMKSFYERALFLVNTSDYEGFPNTFIEAAVNHTPVLSLNCDPNSMLSAHGAGCACQGNFDIMKNQCAEWLQDDSKRQRAGENAFDYAVNHHRLEKAVDQFDHIFKTILNDN